MLRDKQAEEDDVEGVKTDLEKMINGP